MLSHLHADELVQPREAGVVWIVKDGDVDRERQTVQRGIIDAALGQVLADDLVEPFGDLVPGQHVIADDDDGDVVLAARGHIQLEQQAAHHAVVLGIVPDLDVAALHLLAIFLKDGGHILALDALADRAVLVVEKEKPDGGLFLSAYGLHASQQQKQSEQ